MPRKSRRRTRRKRGGQSCGAKDSPEMRKKVTEAYEKKYGKNREEIPAPAARYLDCYKQQDDKKRAFGGVCCPVLDNGERDVYDGKFPKGCFDDTTLVSGWNPTGATGFLGKYQDRYTPPNYTNDGWNCSSGKLGGRRRRRRRKSRKKSRKSRRKRRKSRKI